MNSFSERHLSFQRAPSSVFSLTKENMESKRSLRKFDSYPKTSNYKIDELLTLKEFMAKIIIREMIEFMSYFEGEEEPIMNHEKMKVSTENSSLIGFYHIKALK